jgi:hypothetical protein
MLREVGEAASGVDDVTVVSEVVLACFGTAFIRDRPSVPA